MGVWARGSLAAVVPDADGDRLGVAEPGRRRVTTAANVFAIQAGQGIEPQVAAPNSKPRVGWMAKPLLKRGLDAAGEACLAQDGR